MAFDLTAHVAKKPYRQLLVWQAGNAFVVETYRLTETFPKHEQYGLTSQIRRAAVSSVTNIVEGYAKSSVADSLRFMDISRGSLTECEYLLGLAYEIRDFSTDEYAYLEELRSKFAYLLHRFISSKR